MLKLNQETVTSFLGKILFSNHQALSENLTFAESMVAECSSINVEKFDNSTPPYVSRSLVQSINRELKWNFIIKLNLLKQKSINFGWLKTDQQQSKLLATGTYNSRTFQSFSPFLLTLTL